VNIKKIDKATKTVVFDNNVVVDHPTFMETFRDFLTRRIAGETLVPADMERFMRRTSGKNLSQLMKGKKMEGYFEGVSDRLLTRGQKIALATIVTICFVGIILFVVLRQQGMFGPV